jgi:oxaloacetate decarboxylase gamma subunit
VTEQLNEAAMLLGVGMTVVFAFLSLLIGAIKVISWLVKITTKPELATLTQQPKAFQHNHKNTTVNPDIVAAISAAVHVHQNKHK